MSYPQTNFVHTILLGQSIVKKRRDAAFFNTLIYQLDMLKQTGRYDAFKLGWHTSYNDVPDVWPVPNHLFWDSDVAKWIEGACYFLQQADQPHPQIDNAITELVSMIRSAQHSDGYINIHYSVVEPGKRFSNLKDMHELYNAGHLIEAALAHENHYKNDLLLAPILRYVELLYHTFGKDSDKIPGYPGHPEVELALLRLYERTGNPSHRELAAFFILERGNSSGCCGRHYYDVEAENRKDDESIQPSYYPEARAYWYHQAHLPLTQQQDIQGHSVRAMYLLTAAADLVRVEAVGKRNDLKTALETLWQNMVGRKMYITGGIGAVKQWEGFGPDYFLPQGTDEGGCYSETCAAIGVMMLAERMLQIDRDGRFGDIMELCLYNAVLTAMSLDGKAFTYVNQLASSDQDLSKREEWFTCACCPPNVLRLLGQIGGYIWSKDSSSCDEVLVININLFISSKTSFELDGNYVHLEQQTDWPRDGEIKFSVSQSSKRLALNLRIPAWAESWTISPSLPKSSVSKGYLHIPAEWLSSNTTFTLRIALGCRIISPSPLTNQDTVSITRGPIVYCVEDVDNSWVQDHFKNVKLDPRADVVEDRTETSDMGEPYIGLTVKDWITPTGKEVESLRFIPYYLRANRPGRGQMRVGLKRWHQ